MDRSRIARLAQSRCSIASRIAAAIVGVIGLGYVGLPLALRFPRLDFASSASTSTRPKPTPLIRGKLFSAHSACRGRGGPRTPARGDDPGLAHGRSRSLIICVPTPLTASREPDLSFVINTIESMLPHLRAGQLSSRWKAPPTLAPLKKS